jgi:hypothetical protein
VLLIVEERLATECIQMLGPTRSGQNTSMRDDGGLKKHKGRLRADGSKSKNSLLRYSEGGTLPGGGGGLERTTASPAEPKKATVHIKSSCLESYW